MYAIQNIKTGKFVYGTDYRHYPHKQLMSVDKMLTYDEYAFAESDFFHRGCGRNYRIVELEPIKVKRVFPINIHDKIAEGY